MSRSSSSVVTLRLSPRGFRVDADLDASTVVPASWQPWPTDCRSDDATSVAAALTDLPLKVPQGRSRLEVVVGNAWTRFQLVRFPPGVRTSEERQAFLKARFRSTFGSEVDGWHIAVEPTYFGLPVLAVAMDAALSTALASLAERHKLSLRSLQPQFVDAFNQARGELSAHQGAFAQIDGGRVCMALWRQRIWIAVRSQPMTPGEPAVITAMLSQMLAQLDPPMEYGNLHLVGSPRWEARGWESHLPTGWTANWLSMQML